MVAGIIFAALGIEQTLAHVGEPLGTIPAVALCGGVALYLLLGHNAFRLREEGSLSVPRLVGGGRVLGAHRRGGFGLLHPHPRRLGDGAVWAGSV
jgi:low temperature requirement protein LtrA